MAHHGLLLERSVLDATLCFVAGLPASDSVAMSEESETDVVWQSGECGGFECYIEAEDDAGESGNSSKNNNEAFAEYQAAGKGDSGNGDDDEEDGTELLSVSACNNTLSLVYRDPGVMRFVKYLGASAPSARFDLAMEYICDTEKEDGENGD